MKKRDPGNMFVGEQDNIRRSVVTLQIRTNCSKVWNLNGSVRKEVKASSFDELCVCVCGGGGGGKLFKLSLQWGYNFCLKVCCGCTIFIHQI